jgi:ceroid-lipofuscinosis MFS transporter 7
MTQIQTDKSHILKQGVGQGVELSTSTNWRSIYIATVLSFIGSVQFSLYFSALWPYIQILDHGTSENFFGLTVACYSIGQIISSPLFGLWSNKSKSIRHPLCMGLLLMLFGNVIYILMEIFPFHKRYVLLIARFVIGLGSGNVTLLRLYASTASTATDRTKAISYITAGQAIGMVIGPVGQFLFVPLEYPGFRLLNVLSFNLYTAPAWLACLMNLTGLVMLFCLFKEVYAGIKEQTNDADDCSLTISEVSEKPSYDRLAAFICYMTRFTDMFTRTCFEVLAGPLAMMFFALDESHSVTIISIRYV